MHSSREIVERGVSALRLWVASALVLTPLAASAQAVPGSLTLGSAARLAAQRSTASVTARERAIQQAARMVQARADLLPSLSSDALIDGGTDSPIKTGTGGPGGVVLPDFQRTVDMRIRVTQKLFDVPAIGRWKASMSEAESAKASAGRAAQNAAEEGARAYLAVLKSRALLEARIADSTLAAELLDMAKQQLEAGTAISLDVTRSESQLASAISQVIAGRNDRARAELELLRVLALPVNTQLDLTDSLRDPLPTDVRVSENEAVRGALLRRGDVLAAGASATAARRQINAVRAERLPTVALFGQAMSNADGILESHTYGLQVSLPIFDGFNREARVAEARAKEREAEAQWQDSKLRTEVEVRSALLDLAAAKEQVAAARSQLNLAEQELAQARERFHAGVAGNADVITASLTLNAARDVVVAALTGYHAARVGLASAQGATTNLP